jgi:uncharacterized protein YdaU (DUF1376 family)
MHYYSHHIGDFIRDTARLNDAQSMAYLRLLWMYYDTEVPLINNARKLAFQVGASVEDIELILDHFFEIDGDFWRHSRCDKEIQAYKSKAEKAKNSANARWKNANALPANNERSANEPVLDANQEPRTNIYKEANASLSTASLSRCPSKEIIEAYHDLLPEMPRVRVESESRAKSIRSFWRWVLTSKKDDGTSRATNADEGLAWVKAYFSRARSNDFLMGRTHHSGPHHAWRCDFDFLMSEKGKKQVIEKTEAHA